MRKIKQVILKLFARKPLDQEKVKQLINVGIGILEEDLTLLVNSGSFYTRKKHHISDQEYEEKLDEINRQLRVTLIDNVIAMQFMESKGIQDEYNRLRNTLIMDLYSDYAKRKKEAEDNPPPLVKFKMDLSSIPSKIEPDLGVKKHNPSDNNHKAGVKEK